MTYLITTWFADESVVSPAINGFTSEVLIQALPVWLRRFVLIQNRRSGQYYSMNHPSEWLPHRAFKRYCGSKIIVEEKVVKKILLHSMAVYHSALLIIAIAQAYLKLENTDEIIALASAAQKLSRIGWLLRLFWIRLFRRRVRYKRRRRMFLNYFFT